MELSEVIAQLETWATPPYYAGEPSSFVTIEREKCKRMADALQDSWDEFCTVRYERDAFERKCARLNDCALPDGVEWPRFEDGELVMFGDAVASPSTDDAGFVDDISIGSDGSFSITTTDSILTGYEAGERVKRAVVDSWEKLEADAGKERCEYWGLDLSISCALCSRRNQMHCGVPYDLVRRAKKLAGVE